MDPLAADPAVRHHPGVQRGVFDLAAQVRAGQRRQRRQHCFVADEAGDTGLQHRPEAEAPEPLGQRQRLESSRFAAGVGAVGLGQDPGWRALRHQQRGDLRLDRRDELDRAGAGADHADPLTAQVELAPPLGRTEGGTSEALETR
jgi:hypothetical protein